MGLFSHPRDNTSTSTVSHSSTHSKNSSQYTQQQQQHGMHLNTKADPTLAVNEVEPAADAMMRSTAAFSSRRAYRDVYGNPISEPDLSNPTRSRWERPLETIRSFQAAIDKRDR